MDDKINTQLLSGGGLLPPNLIHDDMLSNTAKLAGLDKAMPEFKTTGLSIVKRTAQDDYRYQQINEINELKNLLVKSGLRVDQEMLQKAILMPEDVVFDNTRRMPDPGLTLMKNPFPKPKNVKKKPKKKKVVRRFLPIDF
jgi:hypothetical protein